MFLACGIKYGNPQGKEDTRGEVQKKKKEVRGGGGERFDFMGTRTLDFFFGGNIKM